MRRSTRWMALGGASSAGWSTSLPVEVRAPSTSNGTAATLRRALNDGDWHATANLASALREVVRPEEAYRRGLDGLKEADGIPYFRIVERGYARLAVQALSGIRAETRGPKGRREWRLGPESAKARKLADRAATAPQASNEISIE